MEQDEEKEEQLESYPGEEAVEQDEEERRTARVLSRRGGSGAG